MADIETQEQIVRGQTTISSVFPLFPLRTDFFSFPLHCHLGSICDNRCHLKVRGWSSTRQPGMRSKMAASVVRHERFTPDGPKKKKHTRIFQHVAISDTDTVACAHRHTQRAALSKLGSTVCLENRRNWA